MTPDHSFIHSFIRDCLSLTPCTLTRSRSTELKNDARWAEAQEHWAKTAPLRRDAQLLRHTQDVCLAIAGGANPALPTLQSALRLCAIAAIPENVASLGRMKRLFMVYAAVVDLLDYRDPTVEVSDSQQTRKVSDNCEALVVACGAHLHWSLSQTSPKYRKQRTYGIHHHAKKKNENDEDDDDDDDDDDDEDEVPPEYEKYQRLLALQSEKATVKQMLAEGLDPRVLGLASEEEEEKEQEAPTTLPLLRALRRATGAIRYRQRTIGV